MSGLLILGGGGHGKVVASADARRLVTSRAHWRALHREGSSQDGHGR